MKGNFQTIKTQKNKHILEFITMYKCTNVIKFTRILVQLFIRLKFLTLFMFKLSVLLNSVSCEVIIKRNLLNVQRLYKQYILMPRNTKKDMK